MNVRTETLVVLLVILLGLVALASFASSRILIPAAPVLAPASVRMNAAPPPLTPAMQAQLAASHGFQYLVSYTDRGFEPSTLTIKKGETVRFTNNSGEDLWVAATGASGTIYPAGSGNECGQSAFDSCTALHHGEFWEFTFTHTGTWSYKNNSDTKMMGTITVK